MTLIDGRFILDKGIMTLKVENKGNKKEKVISGEDVKEVGTIILSLLNDQVLGLLDVLELLKQGIARKAMGIDPIGKSFTIMIGGKLFKVKNRVLLEDVLALGSPKDFIEEVKLVYMLHVENAVNKMISEHFGCKI